MKLKDAIARREELRKIAAPLVKWLGEQTFDSDFYVLVTSKGIQLPTEAVDDLSYDGFNINDFFPRKARASALQPISDNHNHND